LDNPAPLWKRALAAGGKRLAVPAGVAVAVGALVIWYSLRPEPVAGVIGTLGKAWRIALIVGLAIAAMAGFGVLTRRLADRPVRPGGSPIESMRGRMLALSRLVWGTSNVVVAGVALVMVLGVLDIPITPILTVAGLGGLAASLAAKTLVTNLIAGTELLLDDAAAPGEMVTVAGITGRVREPHLRHLVLETPDGVIHRIPTGAIGTLANHSRQPTAVVLEVLVGYEQDPSGLVEAVHAEAAAMAQDDTLRSLIPGEQVVALGVQRLEAASLTARVQMACAPLRGAELARVFRDRFGERIAASGLAVGPPFGVRHLPAEEFGPA